MSATNENKPKSGKGCKFAAFDMFGSPVQFNIRGDETYKTVIGCFWTAIMLLSLILAFVWYFTIFVNKTDGEVTSTLQTQDEYPKINFHESGFFLTLYATNGKKTMSVKQLADTFQVEATFHVQTINDSGDVEESTPVVIPFEPCVDAGKDTVKFGDDNSNTLKGAGVKGKALSNDALCSVTSDEKPLYVQGTDDQDIYAYFRIKIMPCNSTLNTCAYYYEPDGVRVWLQKAIDSGTAIPTQGQYACSVLFSDIAKGVHGIGKSINASSCDCGTSNIAIDGASIVFSGGTNSNMCNSALLRIPFKIAEDTADTYFTLSYTEGAVEPDNYEQPFSFFLKTAAKIYGSVENTKLVNMFWKEVEVNTDKGLVFESLETKTSLSLDNLIIDTLDRGSGKTKTEKTKNGISESVAQSFIEFNLYSSNNKLIYHRTYSKIIDIFANIGGISEVIGFVVIFFYAWYNGIRMEQKLLNYGVLNKLREEGSKPQNEDEEWEDRRYFTFGELTKIGLMDKGLGCCFKSKQMNKRKEFYEEVKEKFEERTDVINIMKGVSDVDTLKEVLLTPYQLRLMHYLATKTSEGESHQQMPLSQASRQLKNPNKKLTLIQQQMDNYLKANLPEEVLSGTFDDPLNGTQDYNLRPDNKIYPIEMKLEKAKASMDGVKNKILGEETPPLNIGKSTKFKKKFRRMSGRHQTQTFKK